MSSLNFDIGPITLTETQLVMQNKTPYNQGISFLEPGLIILGIYLLLVYPASLVENILELGLVKLGGVISLVSGLIVANSPHLEQLIIDRGQQQVLIWSRRWFGLVNHEEIYGCEKILCLIVNSAYREALLQYTLWLDLGHEIKVCLGNTTADRMENIVEQVSTTLGLDNSQVKFCGEGVGPEHEGVNG